MQMYLKWNRMYSFKWVQRESSHQPGQRSSLLIHTHVTDFIDLPYSLSLFFLLVIYAGVVSPLPKEVPFQAFLVKERQQVLTSYSKSPIQEWLAYLEPISYSDCTYAKAIVKISLHSQKNVNISRNQGFQLLFLIDFHNIRAETFHISNFVQYFFLLYLLIFVYWAIIYIILRFYYIPF